MGKVAGALSELDIDELDRHKLAVKIAEILSEYGFTVVEVDSARPWGQFFRIQNEEAPSFIKEFFPNLEIRHRGLPRTPKILLHYPMQRNSWQYHNRRKEYWQFLTDGFYYRNQSDEQPATPMEALAGETVIFEPNERHRLCGHFRRPTLVAEIWEHTDEVPSDEDDIVRLVDDYKLNGRKVSK